MTASPSSGELKFYDNYVPALPAGDWTIKVDHTLAGVDTGTLAATQNLVVSAPQFAMDTTMVLNRHPPANTVGQYDRVLPHLVLNDALLPWERSMEAASERAPWLALLVLEEDEITGGSGHPTRAQTSTVTDFLASRTGVLIPGVTLEGDTDGDDPCMFIELSTTVFTEVVPRLAELRFLAHCRESHIGDKAEQGLETNGLFSAIVANRFPAAPDPGSSGARKSIVHLVSLEGLEPYLTDRPDFGDHTTVALVSLTSWTFSTAADPLQDFGTLMKNLVHDGKSSVRPDRLWLRLPPTTQPFDAHNAYGTDATQRLKEGYVPLGYRLRTGEQTLAWYRGPCAPIRTQAPVFDRTPFPTADAALMYDAHAGVFDASLATAWQMGRALALADRTFGQALHDLRRRIHQVTDRLLQQLNSDTFSAVRTADLRHGARAEDELLPHLTAELLAALDTPTSLAPLKPPALASAVASAPAGTIEGLLADQPTRQLITTAAGADLKPVAAWLAKLRLLYPLPFSLLVPDRRMLAPESLRFFHLDENWLAALTDGALSIASHTSRDTLVTQVMHGVLHEAVQQRARTLRTERIGTGGTPVAHQDNGPVSGILLRSALVTGWPNLAVRATTTDGSRLATLRMDRLAADVLLCLFQGVPHQLELAEPQEGFRFGVDENGKVPLRRPVPTAEVPLGRQLSVPAQNEPALFPGCLRGTGRRVLDIGAARNAITSALTLAKATVEDFGPADFALQMLKAPEAMQFTDAPTT
ncbi:hypothetical protein AB0D49_25510 [Streptomyces sp. NPDC048290]|uniref:hypothetical protein n=1 Tax=Streptomyces sp. NPDC048290 TaxID=3155811 RepID=UPI003433332E